MSELEILERIGIGELGAIHRARRGDEIVEIEIVQHRTGDDLMMLLDQAIYIHRLVAHPNIVRWLEVERGGETRVVREHFDGVPGYVLVRAGAMPVHVAAYVAAELAAALAAIHAVEVTHRRLGLGTVACGETGVVKLTGLGAPPRDRQRSMHYLFMSPEQVMGKPLDARSDVFSLGATLYALSCGRPPFRAETDFELLLAIRDARVVPVGERVAGIPAELAAIVSACMARARDARPPAAEVEAALRAFLAWFAPGGDPRADLAALVTSRRSGSRSVPS